MIQIKTVNNAQSLICPFTIGQSKSEQTITTDHAPGNCVAKDCMCWVPVGPQQNDMWADKGFCTQAAVLSESAIKKVEQLNSGLLVEDKLIT